MISKFNDFYSTSGLRDLIFNKIEHTFNLIEIKNEIFKQKPNIPRIWKVLDIWKALKSTFLNKIQNLI